MKLKKLLTALLLCSSVLSMNACNNDSNDSSSSAGRQPTGAVEFWSTHVDEMILQDRPDDYEAVKEEAKINISAVRNEYEGAHIIMTANEDVASYDVEMTDLTSASGNVFEVENITLYNQKYVDVVKDYQKNLAGPGKYPDAILPFDAAKDAKENTLKKDTNQALYFSFYIPQDQAAGTYTAEFTVTYDGKEQKIPVSLKVWDLELPEENHLKSMILVSWQWSLASFSYTYDAYWSWMEALSKYRLSPYQVWNYNDFLPLEYQYEKNAEMAYEWAKNPRNTVFCIPYKYGAMSQADRDWLGEAGADLAAATVYDRASYEGFIMACVEKSFETNLNIMAKAYGHFGSMEDEPAGQGTWGNVIAISAMWRKQIPEIADAIIANTDTYVAEYGVTAEFVEEVANSVRNMRRVVTSDYDQNYEEYVDYWCPGWWQLNREGEDNIDTYYGDTDEQWWYGCNGMEDPLPNWYIDSKTLTHRIISWMQMQYGFEGNLYWAADYYMQWPEGETPEDIFNTGATAYANGDGTLFYPGAMYGLDEPIPTRRLEAIRDGMEDYEVLLMLKENYAEKGYDFENALKHLTEYLFNWLTPTKNTDNLAYSRNLLLEMLSLAESDAGVSFIKVEDDKMGNFSGKVFVKNGYSLQMDGAAVTTKETVESGAIYTVTKRLDQFVNNVLLTVPELSGVNTVNLVFNGKTSVYEADQAMADSFSATSANVSASATLVPATGFDGVTSQNVIRLTVGATDRNTNQDIKLTTETFGKIGVNTSSMSIIFYNDSTTVQSVTLKVKFSNDRIRANLATVDLAPGTNVVTVNALNEKNWELLGSIESVYIEFGNGVNEAAKDFIYFCGYTITDLA